MKRLLATAAAALLAGAFLNAQTPPAKPEEKKADPAKPAADPAKPTTDPAKPTTDPAKPATDPAKPATDPAKPATDPAKPAVDPTKKGKLFSAMEQRSLMTAGEILYFHLKMGELARSKKDDKELTEFGTRVHSEITSYLKPMIDIAEKHVKDTFKEIPQGVSKTDKEEMDKLGKVKDEKKWKLEFYEMFSNKAKKNARTVQGTVKSFEDPEMKEWGMKFSKLMDGQADQIEKAYKEAKNPKKDEKKK